MTDRKIHVLEARPGIFPDGIDGAELALSLYISSVKEDILLMQADPEGSSSPDDSSHTHARRVVERLRPVRKRRFGMLRATSVVFLVDNPEHVHAFSYWAYWSREATVHGEGGFILFEANECGCAYYALSREGVGLYISLLEANGVGVPSVWKSLA
jgi:hypothetical protein